MLLRIIEEQNRLNPSGAIRKPLDFAYVAEWPAALVYGECRSVPIDKYWLAAELGYQGATGISRRIVWGFSVPRYSSVFQKTSPAFFIRGNPSLIIRVDLIFFAGEGAEDGARLVSEVIEVASKSILAIYKSERELPFHVVEVVVLLGEIADIQFQEWLNRRYKMKPEI